MSTPVPIKQWSIDDGIGKYQRQRLLVNLVGVVTDDAQIPLGRHSSDPRCDMPAKRKPPLP